MCQLISPTVKPFFTSGLLFVLGAAFVDCTSGRLAAQSERSQNTPNWIRGNNATLEMRLSGQVHRRDGGSTENSKVEIRIKYNDRHFETIALDVKEGHFAAWLPVNKHPWYSIVVDAICADGARCTETIVRHQLRERVVNGLKLEVEHPSRQVTVQLRHTGKEVAGATVRASLTSGAELLSTSNQEGVAVFSLLEDDELSTLTAWTQTKLVGGYQFSRKPIRDPTADRHTVDLFECSPHEIHLMDEEKRPIEGVELNVLVATAPPEFNFIGVPDNAKVVTNSQGIGIYSWFPNIKNAHRYAEISDKSWRIVSTKKDDNRLIVTAKKAANRQTITGMVSGGGSFAGGFNVKLGTFQDEEESKIDFVYGVTDAEGRFSVDVLPDATYAVFLGDERWTAQAIDLIPYESDTQKRNTPTLFLSEGIPVRIRLTAGSEQTPMKNVWVNIDSDHQFSWEEDGKPSSGSLGRSAHAYTNDQGIIDLFAPEGELEASAYLPDWRASEKIEVKAGSNNEIHLHRKVDEVVAVAGQLIPWMDSSEIEGATILIGAIDGESGDEFKLESDAKGEFQFKTKATKLGVVAYSSDKRFAGSAVIKNLAELVKIEFFPTKEYRGQILDQQGLPVAGHNVWASIKVEDERKFGTPYATTFYAPRIELQTNENGEYRFEGLPCKTKILLGTDTLENLPNQFSLIDEIYLLPDDERPSKITHIGEKAKDNPDKSLEERFQAMLRDCQLGDYHLMAIISDTSNESSQAFIEKQLLNYSKQKAIGSFMQFRVGLLELSDSKHQSFVGDRNWPVVSDANVFVCAYDHSGQELGRMVLDASDSGAAAAAFQFIEQHVPEQQDATQKWDRAFREAKESGKLVWIRTGQRYCGPCFRLSRWLDDHRNVLEKDFVLVKIDNVRDLHGKEVAERMTKGRFVGVPFHAIFDTNQQIVVDSYGPIGNIGYMTGIEGKRHFRKMMEAACSRITPYEIENLITSLED